jgi:hypothetical protein
VRAPWLRIQQLRHQGDRRGEPGDGQPPPLLHERVIEQVSAESAALVAGVNGQAGEDCDL